MPKGLTIFLVILIVAAVAVDCLILKPKVSEPALTQNFSTSSNWHTVVRGNIDLVEVTTASDGYYRLRAGDTLSEGKNIVGDFFQDQTKLSTGEWVIEDGDTISFSIKSTVPITITQTPAAGAYVLTIFMTFLIALVIFLIVTVIVLQ